MHKKISLLALAAVLVGGCDPQAKINSQKIQILSQNILQFEQNQSKQMAAIQSQLTALAPMLDRMNSSYFEKNHDAEFFYHTNTLYLLLMVDKKIEAHLVVADTERAAQNSLAYAYHTNQNETLYLCTAQILDALAAQESQITDKVNAETRRVGAGDRDELLKQIKLSAAPDPGETARRRALEADVAQIKQALEQVKTQLGQLHDAASQKPPATGP